MFVYFNCTANKVNIETPLFLLYDIINSCTRYIAFFLEAFVLASKYSLPYKRCRTTNQKEYAFFSKNKGISSVDEEKEGVEVIVKMNVKRTSTIRELDSAYKVQREQELELQRRKRRGLLRRLGALGIFALTLCTIATVTIVNQVSVLAEKEQEKVALQEELQALEKESNHLKQEIINYNNDEYVSEVARRDYYLSAEGETLFKLPESAAD